MEYTKITEKPSNHDNLEQMDTTTLLQKINEEDQKVADAVAAVIPQITKLVDALAERFEKGGRLFYIGAGTSGRLGILDASEIPPTFGMPHTRVIGLIAGGDVAIRKAVENAEDDGIQAWKDMKEHNITDNDVVVGIAASGTTPYVLGGIDEAKKNGLLTAGITNNPGSPLAVASDIPIELNVGPEFLTGSTRMKSGTSQKLALNMISTALMIKIGRVKGNKMVNMQLSNSKLVDRGARYVSEGLGIDYDKAEELLKKHGSVKAAIDAGA
ncbi:MULTISPECIES: N-acetylmuramic acid 6-phosphate etherase [unclassified Zobellia]|uniref:N-acetylmuramic acid 6-phosphate etherase n=1 Tax=unclassified Zobellia TaxID=2620635 RepID=UPI001C0741B7|nr:MULTISPECIES: N-acetylmuramic acid 6-phosphate etherase [unclassified Zobellia]MBU2975879.1 N-acetylmuramic acid 6-phosphate etherase [Zobellia sp. B3R18]MDO6819695.1 N-acetylmuramic acid 6-phosphate etherase [Zobellia sp. 1_MG-2023]